jgi:hypothetical protein
MTARVAITVVRHYMRARLRIIQPYYFVLAAMLESDPPSIKILRLNLEHTQTKYREEEETTMMKMKTTSRLGIVNRKDLHHQGVLLKAETVDYTSKERKLIS